MMTISRRSLRVAILEKGAILYPKALKEATVDEDECDEKRNAEDLE